MRPLHLPAPDVNLVWLGETDSTNAVAARRIESWEEGTRMPPTVVVAGRQTAGRGRGRRSWVSPPGGLYATWLGWIPLVALKWLPMMTAVCLAQAAESELPGVRIRLKWPNDLVVDGAKLGGILAQARHAREEAWVLVGFGVNIARTPSLVDSGGVATSLHELGWRGEPGEAVWRIVADFAGGLDATLKDPPSVRHEWVARSVHRPGELMRVRSGAEVLSGRFAGFGDDGRLLLEVDGARREFLAAELIVDLEG